MNRTFFFSTKWVVALGLANLDLLPAGAQTGYPDNVVVVIDASGSMKNNMSGTGQSRMVVAKKALKEVLGQIPENTHIGILVFPDGWVYPLGPRNDSRLIQAIDRPQARGGTPLGEFMKKGADRLLEARKKQLGYGTYRLLVVTDGEAGDQGLVDQYTPDIMSRGVTVDVIGVDMRSKHTLATRVHSYRSADDPESLRKAISEVFAEVSAGSGSQAGNEAFDLIAGIPDDTAAEIIKSLSTSGNHPIGDQPVIRAAEPGSQRQSPSEGAGSPVSSPRPSSSGASGLLAVMACPLFALLGIGVIIYLVVKNRK